MFVSKNDIYKKYEKITKADIVKYRMYIQGFKNLSDLLKRRNENGEDRESNYKLNENEEDIKDRYKHYMRKNGKMPDKAYRELCGYLLPSNLQQTGEVSVEQGKMSKEEQEKPIEDMKQKRERELAKYYKPEIDELEEILYWKNRREKNINRQQENSVEKKRTKPTKGEIEKNMLLAQSAREDVAKAFDFEEEEERTFYENEEKAERSRFEEYLSKCSKDKIFRMSVYSFLYNAEEYDFRFCEYYMQVPDAVRDMLYEGLVVQLRETGLIDYADEWTENCENALERIDSKNLNDYNVNLEEEWSGWGGCFIWFEEELDKWMPWIEKASQLTAKRDWECIKMYHQLWINNKDIINEIEYAIDWLARLAIDRNEKIF